MNTGLLITQPNLQAPPSCGASSLRYALTMDPLHATIEEFAADGYTHVECFCPRCRVIRLRKAAGEEW
jgi:hypothetical protein